MAFCCEAGRFRCQCFLAWQVRGAQSALGRGAITTKGFDYVGFAWSPENGGTRLLEFPRISRTDRRLKYEKSEWNTCIAFGVSLRLSFADILWPRRQETGGSLFRSRDGDGRDGRRKNKTV